MSKKVLNKMLMLPLSGLYGFGVRTRDLMFKTGILKRKKFDIPVIVVGNIAVGGTGKTPHTEYIIALLRKKYNVGVISRGYGRKTSGFIEITPDSTPREVGDEPYQMYRKYSGENVFFAVCEDRCVGIDTLCRLHPEIGIIVLDDAFQHRYVDPDVAIVLTEFGRPAFYDHLLPYGRLREPVSAIGEADIVIVTKCPPKVRPIEYRIFKNNLKLYPYQKLFFSSFDYKEPQPVFPGSTNYHPMLRYLGKQDVILAVAGIGNPRPFLKYLKQTGAQVFAKLFSDHHDFTRDDILSIEEKFNTLQGSNRIIMTTEKDAVRLRNNPDVPESLRRSMFYLPIEVRFDDSYNREETFDKALMALTANSKIMPRGKIRN